MTNETVLTIALMAFATILTRVSGLWLMGKVKISPFIERWLRYLPGSLLTAIVTPSILSGGLAEIVAAFAVVLAMVKTKNVLVAMMAGVVAIFLIKTFLI